MKKQEFINVVGETPRSTKEAINLADKHNIRFGRRNAHLKSWFNPKMRGCQQTGSWNLV